MKESRRQDVARNPSVLRANGFWRQGGRAWIHQEPKSVLDARGYGLRPSHGLRTPLRLVRRIDTLVGEAGFRGKARRMTEHPWKAEGKGTLLRTVREVLAGWS
jgi:hypothetical protein